MIVADVYKWPYPQLYATENTTESPHVLVFEITAVAPSVHLYSKLVLPFAKITCHIKLSWRHGVLAIANLLSVHPDVHGRMDTTEMEYQVLIEHFAGYLEEGDIRAHRVAVLICRPVFGWLTGNAGSVTLERVSDIGVDGGSVALCLPVARDGNLPPTAYIIIFFVEVGWSFFRISTPMEQPLSIKTHNLLALLFF